MDLTLQRLVLSAAVTFLAQEVGPALAPEPVPAPQVIRQTHRLPAEGRLQVVTHGGQIQITGWDREEVEIEAIKRAATAAHLTAVQVEVSLTEQELSIRTRHPDKHPARVDYALRVPRRTRLERVATVSGDIIVEGVTGKVSAATVNSSVRATDVGGDVRLRSVNGQVEASVVAVTPAQIIDLLTVNGSARLELPTDASLTASARTVNGVIVTDFPLRVSQRFPAGAVLEDQVGAGDAKVRAMTVNGNVHITRPR